MSTEERSADIREISILELILAIAKRKRFVGWFTFIVLILVTALVFVMPQYWESRTFFAPIAENDSNLPLSPALMDMFGGGQIIPNQKMDMAIDFLTIMDSRSFREDIIRRFQLINYLKITESDSLVAMDKALKIYSDKLAKASLETQSNSITLNVLTRDKKLSQAIADYNITALTHYLKYTKQIKSRIKRQFLETRSADVKARVDSLLVVSKQFEQSGKAVALDAQTASLMQMYADAVSKKMQTEIDLDLAKQQFGEDYPKVQELKLKQELLSQQIKSMESNNAALQPVYLLNMADLPEINLQYARIQLDLMVMKQLYEYIYPLYESAKLDELKDTPAIQILDQPNLAGLYAKPKRGLLIAISGLAAFLLAALLSMLDEFMDSEQKAKLRTIATEMSFRRKPRPD